MMQSIFIISLFLSFFSLAQQTDYVDFKRCEAEIKIDAESNRILGTADYTFKVLKDIDSIFVDAKNFKHIKIMLNEKTVDFNYDDKKIIVKSKFSKGEKYNLLISWSCQPKKAVYFVERNDETQIWTQGQGKYTSSWLPSFDDTNEKVEFDFTFTFDNKYEVIANGKLVNRQKGEKLTRWHYDMQQPMSSYLVAFVIGEYNKKVEISESGIPLEMYYYPEDSAKVEPTYRYTKHMFDFLEDEIGFAYPWQNYKQIPVHDFLYAGMENTGTTIFSDAFMIDKIAFVDKNYVNVNAHELAHQWFGDLVTAKSGEHHWLQEGFATYYALLAELDIFGDDYFYWKLYEYMEELHQQDIAGQSTSLLNPKSSSTTFYKKGAWTLFMLKEKVGEKAFKTAVKNYLEKHQFKNVETIDFIIEVEEASEQDLSGFVKVWLEDVAFPFERALDALKQNSPFIQEYLMADCELKNSKCEYYLNSGISDEAKSKIISQVPDRITSEIFKNSIKVRQEIARSVKKIPLELKGDYETLLQDESYITKELTLLNLWINFPKERVKYLTKTENVIGFNNKNVRLLWLTLALLTDDFKKKDDKQFLEELDNYTSSKYNFEIRMSAFNYLYNLDVFNKKTLINLKQANKHHNWQLKKFSKNLIKKLEQNPDYKVILENI